MQGTGFVCSCHVSGGMRGENILMIIHTNTDKGPEFEYEMKSGHDMPQETGTVQLRDEDLEPFIRLFEEHGMSSWGELEDSSRFALDAPRIRVSFSYGGDSCAFDSYQELPRGSEGLYNTVLDMMYALVPKNKGVE